MGVRWTRGAGRGLGDTLCRPLLASGARGARVEGAFLCLFITAVPNTKLCAWGEEDRGEHVL